MNRNFYIFFGVGIIIIIEIICLLIESIFETGRCRSSSRLCAFKINKNWFWMNEWWPFLPVLFNLIKSKMKWSEGTLNRLSSLIIIGYWFRFNFNSITVGGCFLIKKKNNEPTRTLLFCCVQFPFPFQFLYRLLCIHESTYLLTPISIPILEYI